MKINELFEGYWKNIDLLNKERSVKNPVIRYSIMINGKLWKKEGIPVSYKSYDVALNVANGITKRKNITTQVVPLTK